MNRSRLTLITGLLMTAGLFSHGLAADVPCVPSPYGNTELFLRGGMNSWNALPEYRFTYVCNHYELTTELTGDQTFKVADAGWSAPTDFGGGAQSTPQPGTPLPLKLQGSNLTFAFKGLSRIILDVTSGQPSLLIADCPRNPFGSTGLYLKGSMNSWNATEEYRFKYVCDAFFLNVGLTGNQEFKVADPGWSAPTTFGGKDGSSSTLKAGEALPLLSDQQLGGSASNLKFNFTGEHTLKFTVDAAGKNGTLTIGEKTFVDRSAREVTDPVALSVQYDSRNLAFKAPFGATRAGEEVQFALSALPGVESATLVLEKRILEGNQERLEYLPHARIPMQKKQDGNREVWSATQVFPDSSVYGYHFELKIGKDTYVYQNNKNSIYWTTEKGSDGVGVLDFRPEDPKAIRRYRQTVYQPDFKVPDWAKDAVYYYIFPERFRNGDKANDPKVGVDTYLDQQIEIHDNWNEAPFLPNSGDGSDTVYNNDFFGGDLRGIIEKLDDLKDLGVNTLYLNPIFEAPSNHKYDTADYLHIDNNFGTNAEFQELTRESAKRGMRVILDTSLNHTGSDSIYFDRYGKYPETGAFEKEQIRTDSPYTDFYTFNPGGATADQKYAGWVGVSSLPELKESDAWKDYAYRADNAITRYWLRQGASGWRMDVAPWVSDSFWQEWRKTVKAENPDALTVAETWFNASKHFLGDQFDSTMNYIFRNTVLDYAAGGKASELYQNLELMREEYPPQAFYALMNLLSTHDAARALHKFGYTSETTPQDTIDTAKKRLKLAVLFQMTYPGAPAIYYGDEVGVTGGEDPKNRGTYPWEDVGGKPDLALREDFKKLIALRNQNPVLRSGTLSAPLLLDDHVVVLLRELDSKAVLVGLNNDTQPHQVNVKLPEKYKNRTGLDLLTHTTQALDAAVTVPALGGLVLELQ
ncbi:alpha-amylase family glycosyl hydrolase [Deinococcus cellulosilyticus]|uniref:Glycosyl hydrolase family 13 catalytic domain-containing protein n=1 Tax=Deinococcus cellulosilyticus (strain DSM 18568 / NBRC 106333 / KACC 11606 / 5516J-15) TaxID=1223518 RepID=A0A511MZR7_DEIC1|nr:alpha-amylase family glycosyl hydrolase [Deinococcus cellulosilyticus]GEM45687.1 hypothetical protein DC3_13220 [Deinococcus cellulosilyticus NBRC 106333 = KACC 11606]